MRWIAYQFFCVSRNPASTMPKPASWARLGTSPSARKPIRSVIPGTSAGNTAARPAPSSTTERVKRYVAPAPAKARCQRETAERGTGGLDHPAMGERHEEEPRITQERERRAAEQR